LFDTIAGYLSVFGLGGLLLGVFIEAMGVPFPGGVMVIITGFMVHQGKLEFLSALIAILFSYTAGSLIAYLIGKKAGRPFFIKCGRLLHISPERFEQTRSWLDHSAPAFITFGRFLPGLGGRNNQDRPGIFPSLQLGFYCRLGFPLLAAGDVLRV